MKITCSKCGGYKELNRYARSYCLPCHNEYMRLNRSPYKAQSGEDLKKQKCRASSKYMVIKGIINKKPCEKCGNEKSEMHHEDYSKPKEVTWLCRECHVDLHTERNRNWALEGSAKIEPISK